MSCLFPCLARIALIGVWIWTPLVGRAFHTGWLLPLLGILFLPLTTLAYVLVFALAGEVTGWNWLWVVLALLCDLTTHGNSAQQSIRTRNSAANIAHAPK